MIQNSSIFLCAFLEIIPISTSEELDSSISKTIIFPNTSLVFSLMGKAFNANLYKSHDRSWFTHLMFKYIINEILDTIRICSGQNVKETKSSIYIYIYLSVFAVKISLLYTSAIARKILKYCT